LVEQLTLSLLLLMFELIWTVNVLELLGLVSVHCNANVDCVFELSKKRREKKMTKKENKKKKKNIKREKVRGK